MPFRNHSLLHAATVAGVALLFPLLAQACGGRNQLWEGDGDGGDGMFVGVGGEAGMDASGGFGGGGGIGPGPGSSTAVTSSVSSNNSSAVSSAVSTSVSSAVSSSASVSTSVSSAVSSSASSAVSTSVTSTGVGGAPATSTGVGGAPATSTGVGGAPATSTGVGGGGNPLDCLNCISNNCPQAIQCISDPVCLQGTTCTVQNCLSGGPPNFQCIVQCFNGDIGAALLALQAIGCISNQCAMDCQGFFGGP